MSLDYRDQLVNSPLSLKLALIILYDSGHADHPKVAELRDRLFEVYDFAGDQLKRLYATSKPELTVVD